MRGIAAAGWTQVSRQRVRVTATNPCMDGRAVPRPGRGGAPRRAVVFRRPSAGGLRAEVVAAPPADLDELWARSRRSTPTGSPARPTGGAGGTPPIRRPRTLPVPRGARRRASRRRHRRVRAGGAGRPVPVPARAARRQMPVPRERSSAPQWRARSVTATASSSPRCRAHRSTASREPLVSERCPGASTRSRCSSASCRTRAAPGPYGGAVVNLLGRPRPHLTRGWARRATLEPALPAQRGLLDEAVGQCRDGRGRQDDDHASGVQAEAVELDADGDPDGVVPQVEAVGALADLDDRPGREEP